MYTFLIATHVLACILLIAIILIQSGRGGGLVESFSSTESIFGTKTNIFLIRTTTVLVIIFLLTSLGLTLISAKRGKSLIQSVTQSQEKIKNIPAQDKGATLPEKK